MRKTDLFSSASGLVINRLGRRGFLCRGDALDFAQALRDESADIVFLDPPFNLGKDYGFRSDLEASDPTLYQEYINMLLSEAARVLKPGGSLFLYHLPFWATRFANELNEILTFRHWIAVAMKNGFARGQGLYPAHYALLYYTKGSPARFRRPRLRPQVCKHCGEFVKDYGGYHHIIASKGVNLSDVWEDFSPVRHRSTKHRRANQLPLGLTDRVVQIAGTPDGVLVDPFIGTGTSLVSALRGGMRFVGNDLHAANVRISRQRLLSSATD